MPEVPFPGFHYDIGKADAMADAIDALLKQADATLATVPDKLAALGIVAALLITRSRLKSAPKAAADALAAYIESQVEALASPPSPP